MVSGVGPPHASLVALHFIVFVWLVQGIEPRALHVQSKCSIAGVPHSWPVALDIARHVFQQPRRGGLEAPSVQDVRGN